MVLKTTLTARATMSQPTIQSTHYALPAPLLELLSRYLQEQVTPTIEIDPNQLAYRWVGGRVLIQLLVSLILMQYLKTTMTII